MFSTKKNQGMTLGILLSAGLLVSACGGGSSGSASTPANGKASSAATKSAVNTFGASGSGTGANKPSLKSDGNVENDAKSIRKGIEVLKAGLQGKGGRQKALGAPLTTPENCVSGSGSSTYENNNTAETSDDTITETYVNCDKTNSDGNIERKNGTSVFTFTSTGFNMTFTNFEESEIRPASGPTSEIVLDYEKTNGEFVMSGGTLVSCAGSLTNPDDDDIFLNAAVITLNNFTEEEKEDENADGVLDKHEIFSANGFTMTISDTFVEADCSLTQETLVLNGTTSFADQLNANSDDNYSATFANYTITMVERKTNGVVVGEEVTLSGTVTIVSLCANGTYTVVTTQALFFPNDEECPTEGKLEVSGGGSTSLVVVNPDGSVDFDDNNNGTIENDDDGIAEPGEDKHFDTCDDADVCA